MRAARAWAKKTVSIRNAASRSAIAAPGSSGEAEKPPCYECRMQGPTLRLETLSDDDLLARVSRRCPVVLALLADGRLHLSAIAKLAPHLGNENGEALLGRAVHKSKREIEVLIAELAPRPDVPSLMRRLPAELRPDGVQIRAVGDGPPPAVF